MSNPSNYQPPCTITAEILNRVAAISEAIGRLTVITVIVMSGRGFSPALLLSAL